MIDKREGGAYSFKSDAIPNRKVDLNDREGFGVSDKREGGSYSFKSETIPNRKVDLNHKEGFGVSNRREGRAYSFKSDAIPDRKVDLKREGYASRAKGESDEKEQGGAHYLKRNSIPKSKVDAKRESAGKTPTSKKCQKNRSRKCKSTSSSSPADRELSPAPLRGGRNIIPPEPVRNKFSGGPRDEDWDEENGILVYDTREESNPENNHDDQKFPHPSRKSAQAEMSRMQREGYEGSELLTVYYNNELEAWFVGRRNMRRSRK